MRETRIEHRLRQEIEKRGGYAFKLAGTSVTGMPDRLVLLPGGRIWFVETKAEDGRVSPRQTYIASKLIDLGFRWRLIWNGEDLKKFLRESDQRTP